ncbi:MAG: RdgB/HAM1 family non-canonical purine NTP pyrophosphatase [Chloroflexi bacterium]|nr:MAG: RdgB/HAM1 family non-canonical purine NTP pyrophosphatase [Chloroflexota bacterium]TMG08533.1 MAG: RdgB/HAM1 family non-canonical purine NTP pyrophosphatase [Chloroflexota bacterium]TMG19450.1 MAG: RdgB/HAM1 family non-canonical purine NTP pyrophosphatase [Chloroflexota bacterium]TMG66421.1 MAG: RdgB/HAM1 family non-canonical purine NTP pyrophosphatase [Chloroflexota bacterium]
MPDRPRLVIATGNAGKIGEYRELLANAGVELVAFDTEVDEAGETYSENARLKAEAALSKSGLPSLGDDSGLEVEALGGFPGLKSARLGPTQKERTAELLRRLQGVPRPWKARFVCVIALAVAGRDTRFFEGECRGEVVPEWRGEAGFGYDPIFLVPGTGKTFGEMPPEEKRRYSHRAAAARALLQSGALSELSASIDKRGR